MKSWCKRQRKEQRYREALKDKKDKRIEYLPENGERRPWNELEN
jgi:hypothetical protein